MKKTRFEVWVILLSVALICIGGCSSKPKVVDRRIHISQVPHNPYRPQPVRRYGFYMPEPLKQMGSVVGVSAVYGVSQGVATYGHSAGASMISGGGLQPLLGALLYIPAAAVGAAGRTILLRR